MQTVNPETGEIWTADDQKLYDTWTQAAATMKAAELQERALRDQLVARFFAADKREGTENYALPAGFKLKCVKTLRYNLADAKVDAALDKLEKSGPEGKFLSERVVKFKPSLAVGEYKKMTPAQQACFAEALTIKDGAPTLELVAPS